MENKLFIIHRSEIIQLGLSSLIKRQFDIDSILLSDVDGIKNYSSISKSSIVILLDSGINQDAISISVDLLAGNSVHIVSIRDEADPARCEGECDCCFSINDANSRIYNLLNSHLHLDNNSSEKKTSTRLTDREVEVIKLVAFGKTNKEIAEELCISFHTVISHRKNITEKLGIKSISGLTVYAVLNNIIDTDSIDLE